jgi:hypothetical protein
MKAEESRTEGKWRIETSENTCTSTAIVPNISSSYLLLIYNIGACCLYLMFLPPTNFSFICRCLLFIFGV